MFKLDMTALGSSNVSTWLHLPEKILDVTYPSLRSAQRYYATKGSQWRFVRNFLRYSQKHTNSVNTAVETKHLPKYAEFIHGTLNTLRPVTLEQERLFAFDRPYID